MTFIGNSEVRTLVCSTLVRDYNLAHSREGLEFGKYGNNSEFIGNPARRAIVAASIRPTSNGILREINSNAI